MGELTFSPKDSYPRHLMQLSGHLHGPAPFPRGETTAHTVQVDDRVDRRTERHTMLMTSPFSVRYEKRTSFVQPVT
jgi:hypothetical protein